MIPSRTRPSAGAEALERGDLEEAKKHLLYCVALDDTAADCARMLGTLYAQLDKLPKVGEVVPPVPRAVTPDAPDADQIRDLIGSRSHEEEVEAGRTAATQRGETPSDEPATSRRPRPRCSRCLALNPKLAKCHRLLGVLYAQTDQVKRSIEHYRRYLKLAPDAPDAERVREIIGPGN